MQSLFQEQQDFDFTSLLSQIEDGKHGLSLGEGILPDMQMDKESELVPMHEESELKISQLLGHTDSINFSKSLGVLGSQNFQTRKSKFPLARLITPDESLTTADFLRAQNHMPTNQLDVDMKYPKNSLQSCDPSRKKTRKPEKSIQEKLQSKRERNRQHARNTRVRKKAYIETLKSTVESYLKTKAVQDHELKLQAEHHAQMKLARYKIFSCFMNYRISNQVELSKWNSILEAGFSCVLPVTPYRFCPKAEIFTNRRVIIGATGMQAESQSLQLFLDTIGKGSAKWQHTFNLQKHERLKWMTKFICEIPYDSFITHDNSMAVSKWKLRTVNAVVNGSSSEIEIQGMSFCNFSIHNKLVNLELCFDVLGTIQTLKDALGPRLMSSIPNSIEKAKKETRDALVIIEPKSPFKITFVNEKWSSVCCFKDEEAIGQPLSILYGPLTEKDDMLNMLRRCELKQPSSAVVHTYKKTGEVFLNYFRFYPLISSESGQLFLMGYLEVIPETPTHQQSNISVPSKSFPPYLMTQSQPVLNGYSSSENSCSIPI